MHARTVTLLSAALLSAACIHSPGEPGSPATITVTRHPETLAATGSAQFTATGLDADGTDPPTAHREGSLARELRGGVTAVGLERSAGTLPMGRTSPMPAAVTAA